MAKRTLQEACAALDGQGVMYESDDTHILRILPPWTAEEWMDVIDSDGEHLGVCCGAISEASDVLIESLRERGWLDGDELVTFWTLYGQHEGSEVTFDDPSSPLARLHAAYLAAEGNLRTCVTTPTGIDTNDSRRMLLLLHDACERLLRDDSYTRIGSHQQRISRAVCLSTFLPALHAVHANAATFDHGVGEGFAVYGKDGEVIRTVCGLAIFETKKDLDDAFVTWERQHHGFTATVTVRRVRVSAEKGIEILDDQTVQ